MLPEPPDDTILMFEYGTDVYGIWRDDASSAAAGWTTGDGGEVWCYFGQSVPQTWRSIVDEVGEDALRLAVRLTPHPDDVANRDLWPTAARPTDAAEASEFGS